jgi:hypothetical protein
MWRWRALIVGSIQLVAVFGLALAIRSRAFPLGVTGEWEWLRVSQPAEPLLVMLALAMVGIYATYAALGARSLARGRKATGWLIGLVPLAVLTQGAVQEGAPYGFGLAKWAIALQNPGSSGYYTVAKKQMSDPGRFLADYPVWIKQQDALHVGTHPPGLFLVSWGVLRLFESNPALSKAVVGSLPASIDAAFRSVNPLPTADRAALSVIGLSILVACSLTAVPIYFLARRYGSPWSAWAAATIWPLVPSALMFQPTADASFPLLSATALALAAWAGRARWLAVLNGIVLGFGTQLSLVFFPAGFIVAIVYMSEPGSTWKRRITLLVLTGLGFLATTALFWTIARANPFSIWSSSAANHARFYVENTRRFWPWVVENPIELAIGLGLPTVVWLAFGLRASPRVVWATAATLVLLTISGKNLSEVARLWLPFMPPLVLAAGVGGEKAGGGAWGLVATLVLLGVQTLVLESAIQVVYPITV